MTTSNGSLSKLALKAILQQLTDLYYRSNDLQVYERALQESRRRLHFAFPGLTVVRAEVQDHDYIPAMTHVLAPEMADVEHTLGWHDSLMAQLSLDDGKTTLSDVASLEVKKDDGSWIAGTVSAGGPASQSYFLTTSAGEQHRLKYGDIVRKIDFVWS